jgi:hypothetical protein
MRVEFANELDRREYAPGRRVRVTAFRGLALRGRHRDGSAPRSETGPQLAPDPEEIQQECEWKRGGKWWRNRAEQLRHRLTVMLFEERPSVLGRASVLTMKEKH